MKTTMYMTMTLNGKIADENGLEDFLSHANWIEFSRIVNDSDCLIWGRKTYDAVKSMGSRYLESIKVEVVVVSHNLKVKSPKAALAYARSKGYTKVIISGGAKLNRSFIEEDLVDEIVVDIEPVLIGSGKGLAEEGAFLKRLRLLGIKNVTRNILQLHYKVER